MSTLRRRPGDSPSPRREHTYILTYVHACSTYQVKSLHIIGGQVHNVTNGDLSDGHLTQGQHLYTQEIPTTSSIQKKILNYIFFYVK